MGSTLCRYRDQPQAYLATIITHEDLLSSKQSLQADEKPVSFQQHEDEDARLQFSLRLSKFKGKLFEYRNFKFTMTLDTDRDDKIEVISDLPKGKKEFNWNFNEVIKFESTIAKMKEQFLTFRFILQSEVNSTFAVLKVSLYTLAIGPQNYSIKLKHLFRATKAGIFNFKAEMVQLQKMSLKLTSLSSRFNSKHDEDLLYATFRLITHEDSIQSDRTESKKGKILSQRKKTQFKWDESLKRQNLIIQSDFTSIEVVMASSVQLCIWSDPDQQRFQERKEKMYQRLYEVEGQDDNVKLMLKREYMFSGLNSSFQQSKREHLDMGDDHIKSRFSKQFNYDIQELANTKSQNYTELNNELDMISDQRKMKHIQKQSKLKQLRGECYIGFHKLISSQMRNIDMKHSKIFEDNIKKQKSEALKQPASLNLSKDNDPKLTKTSSKPKSKKKNKEGPKKFQENLWLYGKQVGTVKGHLNVKMPIQLMQMTIGVMTERGIKFSSSIIIENQDDADAISIIKNLPKSKDASSSLIRELTELKNQLMELEASCIRRPQKTLQAKEEVMQSIVNLLKQGSKHKSRNLQYTNIYCLIHAQDLFLIMISLCLNLQSQVVPQNLRCLYFKALTLLYKRPELDLEFIGFEGDQFNRKNNDEEEENKGVKGIASIDQQIKEVGTGQRASFLGNSESYSKITGIAANSSSIVAKGGRKNGQAISKEEEEEEIYNQKRLIGIHYQNILHKTLKIALERLNKRGTVSDKNQRAFFEQFLAIAYFRIPRFQNKFIQCLKDTLDQPNSESHQLVSEEAGGYQSLKSILEEDEVLPDMVKVGANFEVAPLIKKPTQLDDDIKEWLQKEFDNEESIDGEPLEDDSSIDSNSNDEGEMQQSCNIDQGSSSHDDKHSNNSQSSYHDWNYKGAIAHMFNWQEYFYSFLPNDQLKKDNYNALDHILSRQKWQDRIKKRGVATLLIIAEWVKFVNTAVVTKNVFWSDVPGYKIIVRVVLEEMQRRQVNLYPEALIDASNALLANERILSVFVKIIFKKTNVHEVKTVTQSTNIVTQWFDELEKKTHFIPSSFDFQFFMRAIKIMISNLHLVVRSKCLWMVYKSIHMFPNSDKAQLTIYLLETKFIELFFNWSWNVRNMHTRILLYSCILFSGGHVRRMIQEQIQKSLRVGKSEGEVYQASIVRSHKMIIEALKQDYHKEETKQSEIKKTASDTANPAMSPLKASGKGRLPCVQSQENLNQHRSSNKSHSNRIKNILIERLSELLTLLQYKFKTENGEEMTQGLLTKRKIILKKFTMSDNIERKQLLHYIDQSLNQYLDTFDELLRWVETNESIMNHEIIHAPDIRLNFPTDEQEINVENTYSDW